MFAGDNRMQARYGNVTVFDLVGTGNVSLSHTELNVSIPAQSEILSIQMSVPMAQRHTVSLSDSSLQITGGSVNVTVSVSAASPR